MSTLATTTALSSVLTQSSPTLVFDDTLPDAATVIRAANKAFEDDKQGGILLGSAVQRMAYAAMCECAILTKTEGMNHALADILTVPDTKTAVIDRLLVAFKVTSPDTGNMTGEATGDAEADYKRRKQLVMRGAELGAIIASRGLTFSYFNVKLNCFAVWPSMLLPAKATPIGRMATSQTIMLNGKSFGYNATLANGGEKPRSAVASVKQLLLCCKPKGAGRAGKNAAGDKAPVGSGTTFNLRKFTDVAANVEAPVLIAALHEILVTRKTPDAPRKADMPTAWSLLAKVMVAFDEMRKSPDWNTPRDSESKAEIATRKAEAKAKANAKAGSKAA